MHIVEAIVLGFVQGLTEFLPVSSSAHLLLVPRLLHWADPGAAFTAVTQLGTLSSVLVYFRDDIKTTLFGALRAAKAKKDAAEADDARLRLLLAVMVGTVPICVLALAFKKVITGPVRENITLIASMLIGMGVLLQIAEFATKKTRPLTTIGLKDSLIVGFMQAVSLIPGASRSGSTLTGAFLTGLNRDAAVRFSFLLSIPAVLLSGLVELKDVIKPEPLAPGATPPLAFAGWEIALATVIAGVVGYACIAFLLKYLAKHSALLFVAYRIALGATLLWLVSAGKI